MPLIELVKMGIELKDAKKIKDYTRGFLNEKDVLDAVKFLHNEIGLIPTDNLISFVINSDNRDNLHLLVELHKNGFDLNDLKLSTAIFLNFNKIIENPNLINDMVLAERSSDDGAVELLLGPNQFAAYKAWDEPSLDQQADFDKGFAEFRQKNK